MKTPILKKTKKHEAASFEIPSEGRARVGGALEFRTVTALLSSGTEAIEQGRASVIDLSGVTLSDSAGLALLIEWLSVAKAGGRTLRYENIPSQLRQLSALSDVDELLLGT
ncbi:MAG TPA: STAS domain-containing protein [Steroidobacteraceae bacterium]|nr:STAS domain-containing protein [Steroidobacteraceae bacterium]